MMNLNSTICALVTTLAASLSLLFPGVGANAARVQPGVPSVGAQSVTGFPPPPCPQLPVRVTTLSITPIIPAANHTVTVSWTAVQPQCFTIQGYRVKGIVTFANGQIRSFLGTGSASQSSLNLNVPGSLLPQQVPRKVEAVVIATATANTSGFAVTPTGLTVTAGCTLPISVQITQAVFDGLVAAPQRPGQDFFPKVRVDWQINNLPPCFSIDQFTITVKITAGGKVHEKTITGDGRRRSAVIIIDSVAVGSGFAPDSVSASIKATGKATITGEGQREIETN